MSRVDPHLHLDTPCLLIGLDRLEANLRKMQRFVGAAGKSLRPHAKTHKCSVLAREQVKAGAIGICVAKVSEAETLVRNGIRNLLITGPVVTEEKIRRLVACLAKDPSLMLVVDHPENARALHRALAARKLTLNVLLDLDIGLRRTGVPVAGAVELARQIARLPTLKLRGIQAYAGHVQHIRSYRQRRRASLECLRKAAQVFHQFQTLGMPCDIFSGTGTGTYDIDVQVPELTELQTGSYALMDAEYAAIGSAARPDRFTDFRPALSLLTSVVSVNQKGFVTVDAGLKTLYRDGATPVVIRPAGPGYRYDWFGDEYGKVTLPRSQTPPRVGTVMELVVSHCDPTINLFDSFQVTRKGRLVDVWPIDLRGKSQ